MFSRVLPIALLLSTPALAAQPFDGEWSMSANTQSGNCSAYTFQVGIRDGLIQTPPGVALAGAGRVSSNGAVAVNFTSGANVIQATGRASRASASGRWTAPTLACAGTWQAQRQ